VSVAFPRSGAAVANAFATALGRDASALLAPSASPSLRCVVCVCVCVCVCVSYALVETSTRVRQASRQKRPAP
jgi:hypothetical protein